jgi:predicted DNA repair protein MutK
MATSLFALLDDITSVLDDVATLTKVATRKTAGVLGDDLALNAQQVTGIAAERELPVVWAVAKGSLVNKAILVPAALLISAFAPWAITPLLMIGGLFLCFEGAEKLVHRFLHRDEQEARRKEHTEAVLDPAVDLVAFEKDRIKGAIRTDFILSAEIIVISLGTVANSPLDVRIGVLVGIALLMTVGVYGLVAGIVKLDDGALALVRTSSSALRALGRAILRATPWLMKSLSVAGTAAMFLVGGGILAHGIPAVHHAIEDAVHGWPRIGAGLTSMLLNALVGIVAGLVVVAIVKLVQRLRSKGAKHASH